MTLTVGSLFSGIGGLDRGLERAGMRVVWQAEVDPYCCKVLAKHWRDVPNLGDVTTIDWNEVPRVDLICGGYPCQPFSLAGVRRGEADPRHLWPHFALAIRALRPRWALLENVPGHLSLGFGRVLGDLAESGYDAEWDCIPAAALGAPHRRDRVFIVAYPQRHELWQQPVAVGGCSSTTVTRDHGTEGAVADANRGRLQIGPQLDRQSEPSPADRCACGRHVDQCRHKVANTDRPRQSVFQGRQAFSELARHRTAGRAGWWGIEPDVGRVADGVPSRVDRLRALGNAVVPHVAEYVGRLIMEDRRAGAA